MAVLEIYPPRRPSPIREFGFSAPFGSLMPQNMIKLERGPIIPFLTLAVSKRSKIEKYIPKMTLFHT